MYKVRQVMSLRLSFARKVAHNPSSNHEEMEAEPLQELEIYKGLSKEMIQFKIESLVRPTLKRPNQCSYAFVNCLSKNFMKSFEKVPLDADDTYSESTFNVQRNNFVNFISKEVVPEGYTLTENRIKSKSEQLGQPFHYDNAREQDKKLDLESPNNGIIFLVHLGLRNAKGVDFLQTIDSTQFSLETDSKLCVRLSANSPLIRGKPLNPLQFVSTIDSAESFVTVHSADTCHRGVARVYPLLVLSYQQTPMRSDDPLQVRECKHIDKGVLSHDIDLVACNWLKHLMPS